MGRTQKTIAPDGPTGIHRQTAVGDSTNRDSKQSTQGSHKQIPSPLNEKNLSRLQAGSMLDYFLHETDGPISGSLVFGKPEYMEKKWPRGDLFLVCTSVKKDFHRVKISDYYTAYQRFSDKSNRISAKPSSTKKNMSVVVEVEHFLEGGNEELTARKSSSQLLEVRATERHHAKSKPSH